MTGVPQDVPEDVPRDIPRDTTRTGQGQDRPSATASARGTSNRRKGHDTERALAVYLRQWWPEAARKADNGWRRGDVTSPDVGDIRGTPGVVWQAKHVERLDVTKAMAETERQAIAAEADYGVLVQRRPGHADPGMWWAWLTVADLGRLLVPDVLAAWGVKRATLTAPVRLELRHVVALLRNDGYGRPLHDDDAAPSVAL